MQSVLGPGYLVAGRYRLLDQVGRGAMGIVWRSRDELLDRDVAVKQIVLPPMASATEADASYERTLREARTAARLSHPGLVTIFDVVEEQGTPWIVMELVRARPLDQVIAEDGPLPPEQAAQLGRGLLEALVAAHAAGVLHRDVKPSNVLISGDGKAVLTDFGIATIQGDPGLTQAGLVVGTPGFAPPERVRGEPATPASDLWSLGATLYAAVEGRGPFDRAGGSAAIVASVATESAPRAPSAGPLGPVIEALLRVDPAQRPDAATTAQMLTDAGSAAQSAGSASGHAGSPDLGPAGLADPAAQSPNATTATQIVAVPAAVELAAGQQSGDPTGAGNARASAAAGPAGAGPVGPAGAAAQGAQAGSIRSAQPGAGPAGDVVPDLMATPVFAELKMPVAPGSPDLPHRTDALAQLGPLGPSGRAGLGGAAGLGGLGGLAGPGGPADPGAESPSASQPGGPGAGSGTERSRRGLVLLAAAAALAIVIGGVWFEFPSFRASIAQGLDQSPNASVGSGGGGSHQTHGSSDPKGADPGTRGSRQSSPGSAPSGGHTTPGHSKSGGPSPSGKPTPSGSPSPTVSPSPTPSPTTSQPPPAGYVWQSVPAVLIGTTAGFRVAAPASWLIIPGLVTVFRPPLGSARMDVDLNPFAVQGPVREAKYKQAVAIATHRYHDYHLVSILATTFHGHPAATWTFWWRARTSTVATDVTEVIFTAQTSAGPQPYVLSMSAPATRAGWASTIFRVAMRTFKPLP